MTIPCLRRIAGLALEIPENILLDMENTPHYALSYQTLQYALSFVENNVGTPVTHGDKAEFHSVTARKLTHVRVIPPCWKVPVHPSKELGPIRIGILTDLSGTYSSPEQNMEDAERF